MGGQEPRYCDRPYGGSDTSRKGGRKSCDALSLEVLPTEKDCGNKYAGDRP